MGYFAGSRHEFDTTDKNIFITDLTEEKFSILDQVKNNDGYVKPLETPGIGINPDKDFIKSFNRLLANSDSKSSLEIEMQTR